MQANQTRPSLGLNVGRLLSGIAIVFCVPLGTLFVSVATGAVGRSSGSSATRWEPGSSAH